MHSGTRSLKQELKKKYKNAPMEGVSLQGFLYTLCPAIPLLHLTCYIGVTSELPPCIL